MQRVGVIQIPIQKKSVRQAGKFEHWILDDTKELLMLFKFANGTAVRFLKRAFIFERQMLNLYMGDVWDLLQRNAVGEGEEENRRRWTTY